MLAPTQLTSIAVALATILAGQQLAQAEPATGLRFSHGDWEIACSNTRQCQLAGYPPNEGEDGVSVLLSRRAGPNQAIKAQLQLAHWDENSLLQKAPQKFNLTFKLNQRNLGKISMNKTDWIGDLSAEQTQALLQALTRKSEIVFEYANQQWQLSDKGAAAVLLKADEFQGRLDTSQAWIKKGSKAESSVLPEISKPVIKRVRLPKAQPQDESFIKKNYAELLAALRKTDQKDDCPAIRAEAETKPELSAQRLNANQFLVSASCWRAAYNEGDGYWLVNASKPFKPELVTTYANDFDDGIISSNQKGRGLGDCWSSTDWVWDGKQFQLSASSHTGMCRLIAPGGAWQLVTHETEVK